MENLRQTGKVFLRSWTAFVEQAGIWIVLLTIALTAIAFNYTVNNLGMNTDTKDMLSPELNWRQLDLEYERHFPQFTDNILVVVEADTPDQALDAADLFYRQLLDETTLFKSVYYPNALSIFKESALLFLDVDELQDLADNLAEIQPFLSRLTDDQTLRGFFSMLSEALDAIQDGEKIDIAPMLNQINLTIDATLQKKAHRMSWHNLMRGKDDTNAIHREFILLQPNLDYGELFPARASIERLRQLAEQSAIEENIGARIRLTGGVVLSHEELLSVSQGMEIAMVVALCMVTVIMLLGLGSMYLVFVSLFTLIVGLIMTAAFATWAVGELNLISVAFAVLYIGLGVDFAIHYCLRYREFILHGSDNAAAIMASSLSTGSSMFLCALTTATGFYAFIPTDYDGVAELGLISGTGMFISLVVTLTLLPALLSLLPLKVSPKERSSGWLSIIGWIFSFPFTYARQVKLISFLIAFILLGLITQIRFDHNTLNLQDPENESVKTFQDLLDDTDTSPWTGIILADGETEALHLIEKFKQLPLVDKLVWIRDFIPDDQDDKLAIIEEMDLLLGKIEDATDSPAISDDERITAVTLLADKLDSIQPAYAQPELLALKTTLHGYLAKLSELDATAQSRALIDLEKSLLASLPGRLDSLRASLNADTVSNDNLPPALANRWHNEQDRYVIKIYPRENVNDNDALRRFAKQLQDTDSRVIGSPIIVTEASDAVVSAFKQAFLYAFIVITLILLLLLVHKRDTLYILIPLIMAAIFTGGASVLLGIPFNFANIIALPLILGIGVDSGIHILHRFRTAPPADNNLLATSSARAVLVSAVTTMGSVGNLAFSPHLGTASMGKILTIGIGMTLVCMLIVLPSLLATQSQQK